MEPWKELGVSRAWYFRAKKQRRHESLVGAYINWRRQGIGQRPWSTSYETNSMYRLRIYLNRYPIVTKEGILSFISEDLSYSQKKDRHAALSGFCKYLVFIKQMSKEDYLEIKGYYPRRSNYDKPKQRIISSEEARVLYNLDDNIAFLLSTGLRISEFSDLKPQDIKDDHLIVRCGKRGKTRLVPITAEVKQLETIYGRSRHHWQKYFKQIAEQTGIDFSAHTLRHYRISAWANNPEIPITYTQQWAGHDDLQTTQKYIHVEVDKMLALGAKVSSLF